MKTIPQKLKLQIAAAVAFTLLAGAANGQADVVRYTFSGASTAPLGLPAGLSASNFANSGSTGFSANANNAFINGATNDEAPGDEYFEFSITPDAGHELDIRDVFFDYGGEDTGYAYSLAIRSSLDSFSANIAEVLDVESAGTGAGVVERLVADLSSDANFQNVSSSITFRIYGWGDNRFNESTERIRIDDVKVRGTVSPIPEPSQDTLVGAVLLVVVGSRIVRRNRR